MAKIHVLNFVETTYRLRWPTWAIHYHSPRHSGVLGYASLVYLITFLLGLIILMLGIIGEYLWRIFDEVNLRPETVIDEVT